MANKELLRKKREQMIEDKGISAEEVETFLAAFGVQLSL